MSLSGSYYPKRIEDQLDLNLTANEFPVKVIEPFTQGLIDQVQGTFTGTSHMGGNIKTPIFDGLFTLNKLALRVIYLNEKIFVDNQDFFLRPNLLAADAMIISDALGKKSMINFSLFHHQFKQINFDLSLTSLDVFRTFNTTKKDNGSFYGPIFLSPGSSMDIESDYDGNINIFANLNSGQDTKITIPIFDNDTISKRPYIYFKETSSLTPKPSEKSNINPGKPNKSHDAFKLNLDMDINLNKDAEVELLFDEFSDNKIQAKGSGNINLKINDHNDFNIYGSYEITEGFYLLNFSKVFSKKFSIKSGSKLTWAGDPYAGRAEINATYEVRTVLDDLGLSITDIDSNKRILVEMELNISGNYLNPDLAFFFKLPSKYEEVEILLNISMWVRKINRFLLYLF